MPSASASASSNADEDASYSDWASSLHLPRAKSLFDDSLLDSAEDCVEYDARVWGFDLREVKERLGLDDHQLIRLVNHLRLTKPTSESLLLLSPSDSLFSNDDLLKPVLENDPLLLLSFSDSWSDDDEPPQSNARTVSASKPQQSNDNSAIDALKADLAASLAQTRRLQELLEGALEDADGESSSSASSSCGSSEEGGGEGKKPVKATKSKSKKSVKRDDDTHYFDSYAQNEIHEQMLLDTTRTLSYALFLLSPHNAAIFRDATVLDVGCGTGILSLFAARAGAKKVYAVEASGLVARTRGVVERNGFGGVIEVIQGKMEEVQLPVKEVDIIISEWMGYGLLYESMLDSVLHARDRYLKSSGLMVPSQTRMVLAGITAQKLYDEREGFWESVYGMDLSPMKLGLGNEKEKEGLVEVVDAKEICTTESVIKDINTHLESVQSLDFSSPFTLLPTASPLPMRALLLWFDTFFSPSPLLLATAEDEVELTRYPDDAFRRAPEKTSALNGEGCRDGKVSFTTGPKGKETHWRQVAFMLKDPVILRPGDELSGIFHLRKSRTNSRELDVEVHYSVVRAGEEKGKGKLVYETFRVC